MSRIQKQDFSWKPFYFGKSQINNAETQEHFRSRLKIVQFVKSKNCDGIMIVLGCGDSSFQNIVHFILSNDVDFPANISAKNLLSNILLLVITVLKNIYINSCNINLIYFQHCYFRGPKKAIVF